MTYTPYAGDAGVRSAVAANLGATLGIEAESDNVLVTPGTQAGLFTALSALVEQGDEVLLADPEYLATERMLHYFGASVTHVPLLRGGTGLVVNPGFQCGPRDLSDFRVCFAQDEAAWRSALDRIVSTVTALAEKA
jgi:DNA-binding transcriptional MocR family regulator